MPFLIVMTALRRLGKATQSQLSEVTGASQSQVSRDLSNAKVKTIGVARPGTRGVPPKIYELANKGRGD